MSLKHRLGSATEERSHRTCLVSHSVNEPVWVLQMGLLNLEATSVTNAFCLVQCELVLKAQNASKKSSVIKQ